MRRWGKRFRDRVRPKPLSSSSVAPQPRKPELGLADWSLQNLGLSRWSSESLNPEAREWLESDRESSVLVTPLSAELFELREFFAPEWLDGLRDELNRIRTWTLEESVHFNPPNSMHYGGFELAPVGLEELIHQMASELVTPLARKLYPDRDWPVLSDGHAFLAEYGEGADRDLSLHVDDSDVTLTICLGDHFEGSEVIFEGIRCPLHQQLPHRLEEELCVEPVPGRALVHLGAHRHRVAPLTQGYRQSLILWARGLHSRDERMGIGLEECPEWCGEHA